MKLKILFVLLFLSSVTYASDMINANVSGGTEKTGIVKTTVPVEYDKKAGICLSKNNRVIAMRGRDGSSLSIKTFPCSQSAATLSEGKFNGANEPFGEAFSYLTEIQEKYRAFHHVDIFNTPINLSVYERDDWQANASWVAASRTVQLITGSLSGAIYAPSSKTILFHEVGHAVSNTESTSAYSDDSAIEEAFSDIFAVFFNNYNTGGDIVDWTIGKGYSRGSEAIRYVDSPSRDGAVENIKDIKSGMNAYQRGGFIRKMYFNLYNNLRGSGLSKDKSLELSYSLFYGANKSWKKGMSFDDFSRSIYKEYLNQYSSSFNEGFLIKAMSDVGVSPVVEYFLYSKAGYVSRIKVAWYDYNGNLHLEYSPQVPVAQKTSVRIPMYASESVSISAQMDYYGFKDFKLLFPAPLINQCVISWGTIFSPQAAIGSEKCDF